jgi:hypothetical protein
MRERGGMVVDQLTINKIMDHVLPQRSQESMSAVELSPFDGLPLDRTVSVLALQEALAQLRPAAGDSAAGEGGGGFLGDEAVRAGEHAARESRGIDWNALRVAREQRREVAAGGLGVNGGGGGDAEGWGRAARAGSGIDWMRTYRLLATMQAIFTLTSRTLQ